MIDVEQEQTSAWPAWQEKGLDEDLLLCRDLTPDVVMNFIRNARKHAWALSVSSRAPGNQGVCRKPAWVRADHRETGFF